MAILWGKGTLLAWIKFDKDLINDPRVLGAAEALAERYTLSQESSAGDGFTAGSDLSEKDSISVMRNAVIGALVTLWVYADTHITDGDVLRISVTAIDQLVGIDGFCKAVGDDWIQEKDYGVNTILPGYCNKNGLLSKTKRKAANAERQRRYREKHNAISNGVSNANVTPLDQDQDQDQDQKKKPLASSASALSAVNGNAVAYIPLNDGSEFGVSKDLAGEFEKLYPKVDVLQTLNEIRGWNLANPTKRKTKRGVMSHINSWMSKEQNRGA